MSSDSTAPGFKPLRPAELDDTATLPGEFRAFRSEVRDSLSAIARALTSLVRIEEGIADVRQWQAEQERRLNACAARIDSIDARVAALEAKKQRKRK